MGRWRRGQIICFGAFALLFIYPLISYYLTSTNVFIIGEMEGPAEDRYIFTEDACYVDVWRAGEDELVKKIYVGDRIQALAYSSPGGRGDHRDVNDRVYYGISLKTLSTKGLREDHEVIKRSLKNWVELQTKFEFFEGSWRDRNAVKSSDRREAG